MRVDAKGGYGYGGDNSCFVAILDMEILVPVMKPIVLQVFRRCGAVKGLVAGYNNNYSDIFTLGVKRIFVVTNGLQMKLILGN